MPPPAPPILGGELWEQPTFDIFSPMVTVPVEQLAKRVEQLALGGIKTSLILVAEGDPLALL